MGRLGEARLWGDLQPAAGDAGATHVHRPLLQWRLLLNNDDDDDDDNNNRPTGA